MPFAIPLFPLGTQPEHSAIRPAPLPFFQHCPSRYPLLRAHALPFQPSAQKGLGLAWVPAVTLLPEQPGFSFFLLPQLKSIKKTSSLTQRWPEHIAPKQPSCWSHPGRWLPIGLSLWVLPCRSCGRFLVMPIARTNPRPSIQDNPQPPPHFSPRPPHLPSPVCFVLTEAVCVC